MPRYELNISCSGQHWSRVIIAAESDSVAQHKAGLIGAALTKLMGTVFEFRLTKWVETGSEITIK